LAHDIIMICDGTSVLRFSDGMLLSESDTDTIVFHVVTGRVALVFVGLFLPFFFCYFAVCLFLVSYIVLHV